MLSRHSFGEGEAAVPVAVQAAVAATGGHPKRAKKKGLLSADFASQQGSAAILSGASAKKIEGVPVSRSKGRKGELDMLASHCHIILLSSLI